ncbi:MAG: polyprenyl synthetase family protein [Clostridia bacterium]|nr:polyprenyl synthetase family protein [Clostridia bacterium]
MESSEFNVKRGEYADRFESYARAYFSGKFNTENTLFEAMKYSFFAGGKRIRPILMLAASDFYGVESERVMPFAFALECIHTYSLIHDDLPAMDNDDYRRGKLTNHKVFGEAVAVLAGDALLNLAFSVAAGECVLHPDKVTCLCAKILADYAGFEGMIAGQSADVLSGNSVMKNEEILYFIEKNKTAKLLTVPFVIPCLLAGEDTSLAEEIGMAIGIQFQVVDDILDVESSLSVLGKSVGKDAAADKLTYVGLYGLERAKERVAELYETCRNILSRKKNGDFLLRFLRMLKDRVC